MAAVGWSTYRVASVHLPESSSMMEACLDTMAIKTQGVVEGLSKETSTLMWPTLQTGRTGGSVADAVAAVRSKVLTKQ